MMSDEEKKFRKAQSTNKWMNLHPWYNNLHNARKRCNYEKHCMYPVYGGRGIKCTLTISETEKLWFRDKAHLMDRPSLDRKDNNGNYEFSNCRFLEMKDNVRGKGRK